MSDNKKPIVLNPKRTGEAWRKEDKIRRTEVAFITDHERRPVEWWWDQLSSDYVTVEELVERSERGQWLARREKFWEEVKQKELNKIQLKIISDEVRMLEDIRNLRNDALDVIKPQIINGRKIYPTKPGTMEGMIGAVAKLTKLEHDLSRSLLGEVEPNLKSDVSYATAFSSGDINTITKALLERKYAECQRELMLEGHNGDVIEAEAVTAEEGYQEEDSQEVDQEEGSQEDQSSEEGSYEEGDS